MEQHSLVRRKRCDRFRKSMWRADDNFRRETVACPTFDLRLPDRTAGRLNRSRLQIVNRLAERGAQDLVATCGSSNGRRYTLNGLSFHFGRSASPLRRRRTTFPPRQFILDSFTDEGRNAVISNQGLNPLFRCRREADFCFFDV